MAKTIVRCQNLALLLSEIKLLSEIIKLNQIR